jgi:hypothetical protein
MQIEFFETDESGEHIIAVIDRRRMILSTSKTVADILKMVPKGESTLLPEIPEPIKRQVEALAEVVDSKIEDAISTNETDIQREDKVKLIAIVAGLKDASGNELSPRQGLVTGAVYRVVKVNQTIITVPGANGESELKKFINSLEVIDDTAPRPERITVLANEVQLYQKRGKQPFSFGVISEILRCPACGHDNAFILDGDSFKGTCDNCKQIVSVSRLIEFCSNEKCLDSNKNRSKVALYLYGNKYAGVCGVCKTQTEKVNVQATTS